MAYWKTSNIKIDNNTIKYDSNGQLVSVGGSGGGGGDASIDDTTPSSTTTYSSNKIESLLDDLEEEIIDEYGGNVLSYTDTLTVLGIPPSPFYQYRLVVPVMISNSTPVGATISASSAYPDYDAFKAFRRSNTDGGWMTSSGDVANAWIRVQFGEPKIIGKVTVYHISDTDTSASCKKFTLQASNNATSWVDLGVCDIDSNTAGARFTFDIENSTSYLYYRLYINQGYDVNYVGFGQIDLFEKYVA